MKPDDNRDQYGTPNFNNACQVRPAKRMRGAKNMI